MKRIIRPTAEQTMDTFWRSYDKGHFDRSIDTLRTLGYRAMTIDFVLNKDNYYYPQSGAVNDDVIQAISDKIPVLTVAAGASYQVPWPLSLHSLQESALLEFGFEPDNIRIFQEIQDLPVQHSSAPRRFVAAVGKLAHTYKFSGNTNAGIFCTPTLLFNRAKRVGLDAPMHELVHLVQALDVPIDIPGILLHDELEAYDVQAALLHAPAIPTSDALLMAGHVNNMRRIHLGEGNYHPDPEFQALVESDQILRQIIT